MECRHANQRAVAPGNEEQVAAASGQQRIGVFRTSLHCERHRGRELSVHQEARVAGVRSRLAVSWLQQAFRPRTRGVDDESRVDLESLASQPVDRLDTGDPRSLCEETFRFDIVADRGPEARSPRQQRPAPAGADCTFDHLRTRPRRSGCRQRYLETARSVSVRLRNRVPLTRRAGSSDVSVQIGTQRVIQQHAGAEKPTAALAFAVGGNDEGKGGDEMRRYAQQHCALEARGAKTAHVGMLDIPDSSVHDLEAVS